jgi:hypothetical protein
MMGQALFARSIAHVSLICLGALACGGGVTECLALPCAFPFAIEITVRSPSGTVGVAGAFVTTPSAGTLPCTGAPIVSCMIPGHKGSYELDIGAPGFKTVHRSVVVTGTDAGCGTCGSVDLQRVDVTLAPA